VAVVVVTNAAIAPLLLPVRTPSAGRAPAPRTAAVPRRGLSLPEPPITRTADTVYGMSALDRGGRIADRTVIEALDWTTGTRLHLDAARTHLTLRAAIDGVLPVKDHRYLWVPPRPGTGSVCGPATACCWPRTHGGRRWSSTHPQPLTSS
jgi:hypothetical protein